MSTVIDASIVIDAPRPSVWFTLLNFSAYPRWMEGVEEVRKVGESTLFWRAELGGRHLEWEAEIVAMEDDQLLEWHSRGSGPNDVRFELHPESLNTTRVVVRDRFRPEGLAEKVGTAVGLGRRRLRKDLENLKTQLETAT